MLRSRSRKQVLPFGPKRLAKYTNHSKVKGIQIDQTKRPKNNVSTAKAHQAFTAQDTNTSMNPQRMGIVIARQYFLVKTP